MIRSQAQMCCLATMDLAMMSSEFIAEQQFQNDTYHEIGEGVVLGDHVGLPAQGSLCPRTPDQTCLASCEEGYFPSYVLRRQSEQPTKREQYICSTEETTNLGLIFGGDQPYWKFYGDGQPEQVDAQPPFFSCGKPKQIFPNNGTQKYRIIDNDEQRWFQCLPIIL